jgi:hypothetical protein
MELSIRGQNYSIEAVTDIQILPLAKVFGMKDVPDETSPHYERWKAETTNVFMEPANQAVVSYVLTSLIPGLDPAIARYRIKRYDEGFSEVDFHLAINMDELLAILDALNPYINKRGDALKAINAKQKPKGFDAPKQVKQSPEEQRIQALESELQELRQATPV